MTVSMNLHDCAAKEKQRATLARQVAEYERRHGPVKTIPPQRRPIRALIWSSTPSQLTARGQQTASTTSATRRG